MTLKKDKRLELWRRLTPALDTQADDPTEEKVADIWASIEPKSGSETERGDQQQGQTTVTITTRWGVSIAAMDSSWWAKRVNPVTHLEETYHFTSVVNVGEANAEVVIEAVRV
jgi:head-tail adaptor